MPKDNAYLEAEKKIEQALQSGATQLNLSVQRYSDKESPRLTEIPESLAQLTQLKKLNISNHEIEILPEFITKLTDLESLNLSKNKISVLPDTLGKLIKFLSLEISFNKLTTLPESLVQLGYLQTLILHRNQLETLPEWIGHFTHLQTLNLSENKLTSLPPSLGQLTQLTSLNLSNNQLTALPPSLGQLTQLTSLNLSDNQLTTLPDSLGQLTQLTELNLSHNQLIALPEWLANLTQLQKFRIYGNQLTNLPEWIGDLTLLEELALGGNELSFLPNSLYHLTHLRSLNLHNCSLKTLPEEIASLTALEKLRLGGNQLTSLPASLGELSNLKVLYLVSDRGGNLLNDLPPSLARLEYLETLYLEKNPLNPALQSAWDACSQGKYEPLFSYLRSLEQNAEPLYEAKLVLVGEGGVGKTTLLNALMKRGDRTPKQDEATTHGVKIDVNALQVPHPEKEDVKIQLNAWDFGGQEIYRVTHQFFFSRRSLYLLVWEPRRGVQQCQVEDWLNMIRLRVGDDARVIIVSTNSKSGGHIARIDQPVFKQQYGEMIVGFHEVDSLVSDPEGNTGEMVGIAELKRIIAAEATKFNHVGMLFNNDWKAARDELIARPEPHVSYSKFAETCAHHGLSEIDTTTLAAIMNDLGHIVHYSDDEKLRDDVILKPEWLTKAIGFVLEDRATQDAEGILPDKHLYEVWHDHQFKDEPRYTSDLYPFFLRLMEKYDVSYRLPDDRKASLVAQHVPQIRPDLPWLPEQEPPKDQRRIAMVCTMEEDPPGLVPWMIVRTHDYSVEQGNHHLHWQKGMFLSHGTHGQAMLEKRDREFHIYAQAAWPEHFMNVLHSTLEKLITDNWPGLKDRYRFMVPCTEIVGGQPCKGRFNIHGLRKFLTEGDTHVRCQECSKRLSIAELLLGFEERDISVQLREINEQLMQAREQISGLDSRIANYFWATMNAIADEAKSGPRLFTFRARETGFSLKPLLSRPLDIQLWCEAEGCQHPVIESGKGVYPIDMPHEWLVQIAPYANFALRVLSTVAPIAAPAINTFFGSKTTEKWGIADQLSLASAVIGKLPVKIETSDRGMHPGQMLSEPERSGILALHQFLNKEDSTQSRLGLHRVATYTGDYRWLCKQHYDAWQPNIPDEIQSHG